MLALIKRGGGGDIKIQILGSIRSVIVLIRPKKRNCLFPVTVRKNRVGRSVKIFFFALLFFVKNVCFMHVLLQLGVGREEKNCRVGIFLNKNLLG